MRNVIEILNFLINQKGVSTNTLSGALFGDNDRPRQALERVLKGQGRLSFDRVVKLASFAGISVDSIATGEGWKSDTADLEFIKIKKGEYLAAYCKKTGVTVLTKKEQEICTLYTPEACTLKALLEAIENEIQTSNK